MTKLIVGLPSENIYYFAVDLVLVMEETKAQKLVLVIPK
jgi:hypothetical protein